MSEDSEHQLKWQPRDRAAGVVFLIGVIAGLIVFALFIDDRITSPWGDWIAQGLAMIVGVAVSAACLVPFTAARPNSLQTLRHTVNGILLIASVWGTAAAAAYWGSERLSSAVWLMSLGGFGLLLQKLFAPNRSLGCWSALYIVSFISGALAAVIEIIRRA